MLSAPVNIAPMIDSSFGVGLAAPDFTRSLVNFTCSFSNRRNPARSASPISGTRPACDTRFSSSNTALSRRHTCNACTESVLPKALTRFKANPIIAAQRTLSPYLHADSDITGRLRPRIEAKAVTVLAASGIGAARQVYTTVPADAVRVAALVEISAAAAALARTVVRLRHLDPDLIAPLVSDRTDLRAVLGRGRWLPTMCRHVP